MREVTMNGIVLRATDNPKVFELEFELQGEYHGVLFASDEINGALGIILEHRSTWSDEERSKVGFFGHKYILGMRPNEVIPKTGVRLANYLYNFGPVRVFFYHNAERISDLIGR
jgi:hypothetical protein